ncbi:class II aldolase/adducin family protein [Heliophilum fasciatum]|uniref:L-fuculose-phosphate aldolase n=1 Tax=Heliophilum fasciatum TaxID=35700 RepID=A0A4R2RWR5_9FIRM|nr:class II aldolase/adducin family protein [Heliophilum fasciatum]MCW2276709.1 L-fuculose-phosphate aldolase [Heliophilum fasciatum]TCP68910.1 L-fuculose-phosphate aldolase [Heliophilum fasciatum]
MEASLRKEILQYGRKIIERGLVADTGGNISVRLSADHLLITPSGMTYDRLTPDDLVVVALATGEVVQGERRPSIEVPMHRVIYQSRPDVMAIVHTHPKHATAVAATRRDLPPVIDNMVAYFGGWVRTAAYAMIGTIELGRNVVAALGDQPAALLANHGAVAVGETVEQAFRRSELLEECARIYLLSLLAGGPVILTDEEVATERAALIDRYGQVK